MNNSSDYDLGYASGRLDAGWKTLKDLFESGLLNEKQKDTLLKELLARAL